MRKFNAAVCVIALLLSSACKKSESVDLAIPSATASVSQRAPQCAVQDCATGKVLDDGCVTDRSGGRLCASCINLCADSGAK